MEHVCKCVMDGALGFSRNEFKKMIELMIDR